MLSSCWKYFNKWRHRHKYLYGWSTFRTKYLIENLPFKRHPMVFNKLKLNWVVTYIQQVLHADPLTPADTKRIYILTETLMRYIPGVAEQSTKLQRPAQSARNLISTAFLGGLPRFVPARTVAATAPSCGRSLLTPSLCFLVRVYYLPW